MKGFYKGWDVIGRMLGKPPDRMVNDKGQQFTYKGQSPGWDMAYDERVGAGMQRPWPAQQGLPHGGGFWQMLLGGGRPLKTMEQRLGPHPGQNPQPYDPAQDPEAYRKAFGGGGGGYDPAQDPEAYRKAFGGGDPAQNPDAYRMAFGGMSPQSMATPPFNPDPATGGMPGQGGGGGGGALAGLAQAAVTPQASAAMQEYENDFQPMRPIGGSFEDYYRALRGI
jgi:hypothetical protein